MSQPILVRGFESSRWLLALRGVAILLLVAGVALYLSHIPEAALTCSIAGGAVAVGSELAAFYGRRQRRWVEDLQTGFLVTDLSGTRQYHDADVTGVSLADREVHRAGVLNSVQRSLRLWTTQDPAPLDMCCRLRVGEVDPLGSLRERIIQGLQARSEAKLSKGESVVGAGWRLGMTGLNIETGLTPVQLRFDEIAAVDLFDRKICVWKVGQDRPAFATPVESKNAILLPLLVAPRLKEQRRSEMAGLGRVLFERGATRSILWTTATLASLACVVGIVLTARPDSFPAGVTVLMVGVGIWITYFAVRASRLDVHEQGLYRRWLFGERQVRYADLASFTYQGIRQYVNGIYTGTQFKLSFTPSPTAGGGTITYSAHLPQADSELELLRDQVAQIIGQRMGTELSEGRPVTWTPALTIHPDALEHRPRGWFGKLPPLRLPFTEIQGFEIQAGVFHVWRRGREHSVIQETVDQPNFFAGFWVLSVLASPRKETSKVK